MKKIIATLLPIVASGVLLFFILLIPCFMVMDFFGANVKPDGYVVNNMQYASAYHSVLTKNFKNKNGYVSLERILYFYLADPKFTFDEIYTDNLDKKKKKMLPIKEVCNINKYAVLNVCNDDNISKSNQVNEDQGKPFAPPINFSTFTGVTSFFMEERIVFGSSNVHDAWDFSASAQTPVYSVCDGSVEEVTFEYASNVTNKKDGKGGNRIRINCNVNGTIYTVLYAHLFPNSATVTTGSTVTKGQQIASVGTTGYSTGNHLHYNVTVNKKAIDGMSLIDFTYN